MIGADIMRRNGIEPADCTIQTFKPAESGRDAPAVYWAVRIYHQPSGIIVEQGLYQSHYKNRLVAIQQLAEQLNKLKENKELNPRPRSKTF